MEPTNNTQKEQMAECANFLDAFNCWRRGEEMPQPDPKLIGENIDLAIRFLRGEE